jgi:hypothetical protein
MFHSLQKIPFRPSVLISLHSNRGDCVVKTENTKPETQASTKNPIASGQVFIGLCTTRGIALQLFNQRAFQIITADIAGYTGLVVWLATHPPWQLLVVLAIASMGIAVLHTFAQQVITGSANRVELWTQKLILLEKINQIEGGVRIFSSLDYEALRHAPVFPVNDLLRIVRGCMVIWVIVSLVSLTMFLNNIGALPWKW